MRMTRLSFVLALMIAPAAPVMAGGAAAGASAQASVSISIKADVNAKAQAEAAAGDAAFAAGKLEVALAAYGDGFAKTRDTAFIYAMAQCHKALGHKDEAKAMFQMYLGGSEKGAFKFEAEAKGELGMTAKAGKSAIGAVGGTLASAGKATVGVVGAVGGGVYGAVKVSVSASIDAAGKASAKAGDEAYAAGKYEDAAKAYGEAFVKTQASAALYAHAQAQAQAGHAIEARGALAGYLAAQPSGSFAKDAKTLMLAIGGRADLATKIAVSAKVSADVKAQAVIADKAMASGKFLDAAKAYGDAYAKKSDAALLYAKGMAQFYAGATADAAASMKAYLAAGGNLEFKVSAEATLHASGGASG